MQCLCVAHVQPENRCLKYPIYGAFISIPAVVYPSTLDSEDILCPVLLISHDLSNICWVQHVPPKETSKKIIFPFFPLSLKQIRFFLFFLVCSPCFLLLGVSDRETLHNRGRGPGGKVWVTLHSYSSMTRTRTTHNNLNSLWPLDWKCTPIATLLLCLCFNPYLKGSDMLPLGSSEAEQSCIGGMDWSLEVWSVSLCCTFFVDANFPLLTSRIKHSW